MSTSSIVLNSLVDILVNVSVGVLSVFVPVILGVVVTRWNAFVKDKTILQQTQITTEQEHQLERVIQNGVSWVVEQERKNFKIDPNHKIPGEEKLQLVVDFIGQDKIQGWVKAAGIDLEKRIEAVISKNRLYENMISIPAIPIQPVVEDTAKASANPVAKEVFGPPAP